ncbi:MAG: membrane protein insertion efficiency factor YidD [Actinomycetes bacterium]
MGADCSVDDRSAPADQVREPAPRMGDRPASTVEVVTASGPVQVVPTAPARGLVRLIALYQRAAAGRPSPCRYVPSCSTYAIEAVQVHGAGRGGWFAARRLSRCHPWGSHGHDPVPDPRRG